MNFGFDLENERVQILRQNFCERCSYSYHNVGVQHNLESQNETDEEALSLILIEMIQIRFIRNIR